MLHINYVYTVLVTEWIFCQQPLWDRPVVWDHTSNPLNYLWGTASHICHRDGPHCQICTSANGALNQAKHVHFECVWWLIYIYELLLLVLSQKETRARPHPKPINYVRGTATHICCYCQTCSCAETVSCEQSIFQTTPPCHIRFFWSHIVNLLIGDKLGQVSADQISKKSIIPNPTISLLHLVQSTYMLPQFMSVPLPENCWEIDRAFLALTRA